MADKIRYQMLIDGVFQDAENDARFDSMNPTTGKVWASIPEASIEDVNRAVLAADKAFNQGDWSKMTASERGQCLYRLGDLLLEHADDLGRIETIDTGKLLKETCWQAKYIAKFYHFYGGCADKIHGETLPIDKPDLFVFTEREPLGVIAGIIPWNSQLFLAAVKIAPALATGNTIVLKLSEHASAVMLAFAKLIKQAGIPDGVVNMVTGYAQPCGQTLCEHPLVKHIAFTGGEVAARHIITATQHNFAKLSLELGGKSPFIVFDDADIDSAVNGAISGIFGASGQSCVAGSRLYLQTGIADLFLEKIKQLTSKIVIGDPLDETTEMGPLCTQAQLDNIEKQVSQALAQGGKLLSGGNRLNNQVGLFYQPTIIECPKQNMTIVASELFGPVLSVLRFEDEQAAIAMANDSDYGLAAGIFTRQSSRALRVAKAIKAGIVWVNTYRAVSPIAPFGGVKNSGYGRESGLQSLYEYTQAKTVWINTSDEPLPSQFVAR